MTSIPEFRDKIGRNIPCPCGSKRKFKDCHGHHTSPPPGPNIYKIAATLREGARKSSCHVPEAMKSQCSKGTINSHTVSRSGSLGAIQRNGHVYSYNLSMLAIQKNSGKFLPEETGWKTASTFPGFCGYHDKHVFEPLEDVPFTGSRQQCFLIAYRSLAKEIHAKTSAVKQVNLRRVYAGQSIDLMTGISAYNRGLKIALRDLKRHKNRYDSVLVGEDWQKVHGMLIEFDSIFPIQCTGGFFPITDINGTLVQKFDWNTPTPDTINMSSFAANGISYFLICWLQDSHCTGFRFTEPFQTVDKAHLPSIIGTLILQITENCHFSPDWYDGLSGSGKEWCQKNNMSGLFWGDLPPPTSSADRSLFSDIGVRSITTF